MAYASVSAFVEEVGAAEARALAPATLPATGHDDARIERALTDASTELDSYFASRFPVPLNPVPPVAGIATIALARAGLDRQGRDFVKDAAARWRSWARDVSKGLAALGSGPGGGEPPAPSADAGPAILSPPPAFAEAEGRWLGGLG